MIKLRSLIACFYFFAATQESLAAQVQLEFTGKDAELVLAHLETLGLEAQRDPARREYGFYLDSLTCTQVPSPHADASCRLIQGERILDLDGQSSNLIYQTFAKNHAPLEFLSGVSLLDLVKVHCLRYEIYRGVSKCFLNKALTLH